MTTVAAMAALQVGCSPSYPVGPTTPGLTGPVGPSPRSCAGVEITVADDIQTVIDVHPAQTVFCIASGVHRLRIPVRPKRGDSLIGRPGAVLSGAVVLTEWQQLGALWSARVDLPPRPSRNGTCLEEVPLCMQAEDVYLDGRRLQPVGSRQAVIPGTVHADYAAGTITIGEDPRTHVVEQAVAPSLVRAAVKDVTIANLVMEKAANEAQTGAVESRQDNPDASGTGWTVVDNEIRFNHGIGVGVASTSVVAGNHIHHQGQLGIGIWGTDTVVRDNEISYNGVAGYSAEWEAGGVKCWMTEGLNLIHNYVHHNNGPGMWADGGNRNTTYRYNTIADNWNAGIQHEISYDAIIMNNHITGNGRRHKGWVWDAGIQIQSSGGAQSIEIAFNTLDNNANGISLIEGGYRRDETPAPHGQHIVQNVWVHDNVIGMRPGQTTGASADNGDTDIFTSNNNRFDDNTYRLQSLQNTNFSWGGSNVNWFQWISPEIGQDVGGSAEIRRS